MPFLRRPQLMPIKGIDFSIPSSWLPENQNFPYNIKLYRGELYKREGKSYLGQVITGAHEVIHHDIFETSTEIQHLIRMSRLDVERYNTAASAWVNITGAALTGTNANFFSSVTDPADDLFIFTNYIDRPRKIGIAGGNSQDLGGTANFKAKFVEYVNPYVIFANLIEGGTAIPNKCRWSDSGAPEVYTGGNSGSQLFMDEPSVIRGMKKLRDLLFIYKEKSTYRGYKVSTASIFDFGGPFTVGKGVLSGRTIVDIGDAHIYMGLNDFHLNDGVRIQDIGGAIREYLFNRINRSKYETMHAIHVEIYKEVWFFITVVGQDWPTEVWKYNYALGFWYQDSIANCCSAAAFKNVSDMAWDDIIPAWDDSPWAWDDRSGAANAPMPVFGMDTGFTHIMDGTKKNDILTAFTGRLETRDYQGQYTNGEIAEEARFVQMDVWARGDSLKLYYSTDEGTNWTYIGEMDLDLTLTKKYTFWFDVLAQKIRFKFENMNSDETFVIRSFQPYYIAREEEPYPPATP